MLLVVNNMAFSDANKQEEKFYSQNFSKNYTVFILGSSHVGSINATYVNQVIKNMRDDVIVYNLATGGDSPQIRIRTLENIAWAKPDLIFYGISSRDFGYPIIENQILPEPKLFFNKISENNDFDIFLKNPKIKTLEIIRTISLNTGIFPSNTESIESDEYTPFFIYSKHMEETNILNRTGGESTSPQKWNKEFSSNRNWQIFTKIIETLHDKKIKIVLFTTPQSRIFLDTLSQEQIEAFNLILNELKQKYNLKIYDFTNKYEDMNIWNDLTHVAFNNDGIIFSEDIANFITDEIE